MAQVVRSYHMKIVKFQRPSLGVRLRDLYFVYAATAVAFSFHGFYMDGNWDRLQLDGNRLVMHVRLYSLLGLGAWGVGTSVALYIHTRTQWHTYTHSALLVNTRQTARDSLIA